MLYVYNVILIYLMNVNNKRYKYYLVYEYLRGYDLRIILIIKLIFFRWYMLYYGICKDF